MRQADLALKRVHDGGLDGDIAGIHGTGIAAAAHVAGHDYGAAIELARRAISTWETAGIPKTDDFALLHLTLGEALLGAKRWREAAPVLEKAFALAVEHHVNEWDAATYRFLLARGQWEVGVDRGKVRALVLEARRALVASGRQGARRLAELDAWLEGHGGR